MKRTIQNTISLLFSLGLGLCATHANATPILQVYAQGGIAMDQPNDADTWVVTGSDPVWLDLIGNYGTSGSSIASITDAHLIITVPDGQSLSLQWVLPGDTFQSVPMNNVDTAHDYAADGLAYFNDVDGLRDYLALSPTDNLQLNNHDPFGANNVDLYALPLDALLANLGDFGNSETVKDCNADGSATGCVDKDNEYGEIKTIGLMISGVSYAHFDLVAQVEDHPQRKKWRINPGSHDSTLVSVPEPSPLLLMGIGLLLLPSVRWRKS